MNMTRSVGKSEESLRNRRRRPSPEHFKESDTRGFENSRHPAGIQGLLLAAALFASVVAAISKPAYAFDWSPADGCGDRAKEFFVPRLFYTYGDLLSAKALPPGVPPEPGPDTYRKTVQPPPENDPPFPYTTWPMGATQAIGYNSFTDGPLMETIYCGPLGKAIKESGIVVRGWLEPGGNWSTSHSNYNIKSGTGGNNPIAYSVYPNTIQLDQAALYIERAADEVQQDHWDIGFRIANLFGTDYKYTFSHDILSSQYINEHNKYGYDPVMVYADIYDPFVAQGMDIRIGRYISIPDIEAQLAPDNLTYSHSDLYAVDPYTQTGVVDTIRWNRNWTTQLEFSGGNDVAFWDHQNRKPTPAACVQYLTTSGNDSIYPCVNGLNDGNYGYNNLQHLVATWYHKFNNNWHMDTETWYMWERNVPNLDNPLATPLLIKNANGAYCGTVQNGSSPLTCTAPEYAIVNYIMYQFAPNAYFTLRNEMMDDFEGQRTGYKTIYSEHMIGITYWIGSVITLRPELRFDHAYDERVYNGGEKHSNFMFAMDTIFHY